MQRDEDIYRQILDYISEIVYVVEGDPLAGTVRFVGKQVEQILGYRPEEFIQNPSLWFWLIHPDDVPGVTESTRQIIATREKGVRVYRLRHKDTGEHLWFDDQVVPQVDTQGRVTGIWGVARDITARRRQEAQRLALRRVEETIWRMELPDDIEKVLVEVKNNLKALGVPFQECALNTVHTFGDQLEVRTYSLSKEGPWRGAKNEEGRDLLVQFWRAGKLAYRQDLHREDPYGERQRLEEGFGFPVRSVLDIPFSHGTLAVNSLEPEAFLEGHIVFLREVARVLSVGFQRWEDLQRLAHSEARYRALVETPNWVVGLVDQQGHCVYLSPQIEAWTGYAPEEFYGDMDFRRRVIHPEDLARVEQALQQALQGATLLDVEFRWQCRRGDLRWVSGALFPVHGKTGSITGCQIVLQDITRHRKAEAAREQAERTLEEHRALTVRADRLRFLGQMAAGMVHDLNQPLQGIRGQAEHLLIGMERGWNVQRARLLEKLRSIVEQADRMAHIIEHLRVFAREAGRPERRLVLVAEVIRAAYSLLDVQFYARELEIRLELVPDLPLVSANPFSLEEILLNLLTNACDAVEERLQTELVPAPHAIVRTRVGEGGQVEVEVEDRGAGIPADILPRVFDPFFTTKTPERGTGLGLSICKALVEEIGGSIAIHSTPGQGTQVTLSLPPVPPQKEP